jgi:hypothetical protein
MHPWISMWFHPRRTIRQVIASRPSYGVFWLVFIFALQNLLFYANWWSLGLRYSWGAVLAISVLLAPLIGLVWVYFAGWIFYFTGRWLGGAAPASHLRACLAWSKVPAVLGLVLWIVFLMAQAKTAFIQDGNLTSGWFSSLVINLTVLIVGIWSFVLLVQAVREIQGFSLGRSIANIAMGWTIYFLFFMILSLLFRYIYLLSF